MAATLTIVNQHGQTLASHRLGNAPLSIRVQDHVQYRLAGEGGLAPANVEAARAGNDLLVRIDGEAALTIEDYFLLDDSDLKNPLLGLNESGQYVAYGIVEAPSPLPVEHVLAEEVAVASSGSSGISPLAALAAIGGVALTGAVIAGSGKDNDKTDNDTSRQPQTPFDPNQPAPPPADNGNITPPPSGGINPPPSGGGNTNPPPQQPVPNGSISIDGEAKVGQTLTAKITDADGVSGSPQYQWFADGQPIQGATQSTYTLTTAEKGKAIGVQATYTDSQNTPESPTSAVTDPVAPPSANNPPTGEVKISGVAEVGQTLTASHTLKDDDGLGKITYKWFANGAEVGQGDTYTIQAQDKGKTLTVKAEYTDGKGAHESVQSAATAPVTDPVAPPAPNNPPTGDVIINGSPEVGQTLTASHTLEDRDGLGPITYNWFANGAEVGQGDSYTIKAQDQGKTLAVKAEYTDGKGAQESVQSAATAPVTDPVAPPAPNNPPTGDVIINGSPEVGQTLTASHTLEDRDGLGPITYKWFANGAEVGQGDTYTIQPQDQGKTLTVKAEYTDGKGTQESVQSAATAPVTDSVAPPVASEVSVANAQTVTEGEALEYTVTLNAPSRAGQVLKLETLVHNSRVPHDQLAKTADPFAPGEYLANGTVFTRDVKNIAVTPLGNSADISKHLLRLAQYGPKYYENAELMKKLEALDRGENVDIPETGNGAHPTALTALNKEAYNIPIYIVDSTDPNQTYAEFFSTDSRVLASADIMQHTMGRIPFPTHAQPANGGDKSFAVYDKGTGLMREYFHAEMDKGKWKVSSAGYHQAPAGLDELGAHNYWMQLDHGGSSVVMMLNPLSQIGVSELLAGKINHAVSVTLPDAMIGRPSFPAKLSDGSDTFRHAAAEGQWFRIKPGVDLDSYTRKDADGNDKALNPLTLMIAKAAQQYGGYGADRNLHNIAFNAEPAHNYLAQGKEDPWRRGGELYEKLKAPGVNDPFSVNDFPWELAEWMPLDWNARGNDAGVYADENIRVWINGVEHTYPVNGGDIVLPEGVTDIRVKIPTLTHNNFIQTDRVELKAELLENGQSLATDNGSGQVVDAPSPFPDATPDADNSGNDILVSPKLNTAGFADLKTLEGEALYRYLAKHGAAILAQSEDGVAKTLDGGAGNDILISGRGIDLLKGGPGADTFVFIMNGENSQPYHSNDRILDFNPAEDRIILTRGQGWHQTDKVEFADAPEVQRLHFKTWLPPTNKPTIHINAVEIKTHDGRLLSSAEVLDTVRIHTEDNVYRHDGKTPTAPIASNQAPTAPQLSHDTGKSFWVTAGQSGAAIGKVSATDADGDAITYHVSDDRFEIAGDTLKLKDGQSVDYANEKRIILTLTARDIHGAEASRDIAVQVKAEGAYRSDNPHAFSFPVLADGELPVVPHAPQIARAADGSVVITPDANADTLHLRYQDATGKTHLVDLAWNRYEQRWYSSDTAIRPQESVRAVTLPADRLKPGSNVFASNAAKGIYADDSAELVGTGETPAALEAYLYAANRSAVTEGHAAHYLVRLNRAATEDLTFNIALTHKDSDGSDAALARQSVTIRAGERHAAFAVELADDNHAEGTETYKIAISSASGQVRIPASRASLSGEIRDNDQPQPAVDHDDHNLYLTPASGADSMTFSYHDRDYGAVTLNTWRDAGGTWHISELNPDKRATVPAIDAQSGKVSIPFAIVSELGSIIAHHDHIMESGSGRNTAVTEYQGWTLDWRDTFSEDLSAQNWTAYGWGWQAPEFGGMGRYYQSNAFTADGALHLRSQYHDGEWSSTGVSGSDAFSAVGGRWEVRARFPDAKGIGYAFLLWPKSENWPPEVDFAEGRVRDPNIMATYHWGSVDNHMQDNRFLQNEDLTDWHTYGAIVDPAAQTITYTFDGKPWFTLKDVPVTDEALWIGFQTGAQDPLGSFAQYESIDHAIPGKDTPAVSDIEIDWVAHYRPEGAPKILAPPQLNLDYATAAGDSGENTAAPLTVGDVLTDSDTLTLDNLLGAPANSPPPPISPSVADSAPPLPAGDPIRWIDIQNGTEIL